MPKSMKQEIIDGFRQFGVEIKFDPDADLKKYRCTGRVLKQGELKEGLIVWAVYKEHGEDHARMNGAFRLLKGVEDSFVLDDGSSFSADFTPWDPKEDCIDEGGGEGVMVLYEAAVPPRRARSTSKGKKRGKAT